MLEKAVNIIDACARLVSLSYWHENATTQMDITPLIKCILSKPLERLQAEARSPFFATLLQRMAASSSQAAPKITHLDLPTDLSLREVRRQPDAFPHLTHIMLYGDSGWGGKLFEKHVPLVAHFMSMDQIVVCIFVVDDDEQADSCYQTLVEKGVETRRVVAMVPPETSWVDDWAAPFRGSVDMFAKAEKIVRKRV